MLITENLVKDQGEKNQSYFERITVSMVPILRTSCDHISLLGPILIKVTPFKRAKFTIV